MTDSGTFLSRIVRLPLSLIPRQTRMVILSGPVRGKRWVKGAGPNAYWLGRYEVARVQEFANAVTAGAVVYDVGANVGLYSLIASSRAGITGRVYAFEPLERNLRYLRQHIVMNNLENCTVVAKAVCNETGMRRFSTASREPCMARLSSAGEMAVPATTLDNCIYGETRFRPPDILKIDVKAQNWKSLKEPPGPSLNFIRRFLPKFMGRNSMPIVVPFCWRKVTTLRKRTLS